MIISLVASLVLSFSLVPLLFKYLMASQFHGGHGSGHSANGHGNGEPPRRRFNPFGFIHRSFERGFLVLRVMHRNALAWTVDQPIITVSFFGLLVAASLTLYPRLGMDFFRRSMPGRCACMFARSRDES